MTRLAACAACGSTQPFGRIRCDQCGLPLVFPVGKTDPVHRFKCGKCPTPRRDAETPNEPIPAG